MQKSRVTFIIATYKRVDALKRTLGSLIWQERRDWTAIVVGDCCGEETYEAVRATGDPRIRYYNLPRRFGEQSGPNSFGLAMAEGDFVSFLNHDDVLLRDHLAYAMEKMEADRSDFFVGKAAVAEKVEYKDGAALPVFTGELPGQTDLNFLMYPEPFLFDPSSFWLVRTPYAKAVGPWRPSWKLWRTPLRDWLMRAWRLGGRFSFGERITGIRCWTHSLGGETGRPVYGNATPEYDCLMERLRAEPPDDIRRYALRQIDEARRHGSGPEREPAMKRRSLAERFKRKIMAAGYLWFGFDPLNLTNMLRRQPRGKLLKWIIHQRTGEKNPSWDISVLLNNPEACRLI